MPDTQFAMPGVAAPAVTEAGVILMGLDADRLLAGLAAAAVADDPGRVALSVDYARHGVAAAAAFDDLVDDGARRWREFRRTVITPQARTSASVREARDDALLLVTPSATDRGPASRAYLAACWLRREDVDGRAEALACRDGR